MKMKIFLGPVTTLSPESDITLTCPSLVSLRADRRGIGEARAAYPRANRRASGTGDAVYRGYTAILIPDGHAVHRGLATRGSGMRGGCSQGSFHLTFGSTSRVFT